MTKYDHSIPDDAFHSYMNCRIASGILSGEYDHYLGGGSNTPNYNQSSGIISLGQHYEDLAYG